MARGTLASGVSSRRHVLGDQSDSRQLRPPTGGNECNHVKYRNPNSQASALLPAVIFVHFAFI